MRSLEFAPRKRCLSWVKFQSVAQRGDTTSYLGIKLENVPLLRRLCPWPKGETDDYPIQHAERTRRGGAKASTDHTLAENLDENLDGKLDQAPEESFPTYQ
jgi:hypothetical protein